MAANYKHLPMPSLLGRFQFVFCRFNVVGRGLVRKNPPPCHGGAAAQQLERDAVPDLHPRARHDSHAPRAIAPASKLSKQITGCSCQKIIKTNHRVLLPGNYQNKLRGAPDGKLSKKSQGAVNNCRNEGWLMCGGIRGF